MSTDQAELAGLVERAAALIAAADDEAALGNAKAAFLGRSGDLTARLKGLSALSGAE